jgi:Uncharacterized protein conserved in bacteria
MIREPGDITKRRAGRTERARALRRDETEAEYRLWSELRGRHLNGHKFAARSPSARSSSISSAASST